MKSKACGSNGRLTTAWVAVRGISHIDSDWTAVASGKTFVLANVRGAVTMVFDAVQFGRVIPIQSSGDADAHP